MNFFAFSLEKFTPDRIFYTGNARGARDKYEVWVSIYHLPYYGDQHYQQPVVVVTLVASTMMLDDTKQQKQKERRKSLIPAITG